MKGTPLVKQKYTLAACGFVGFVVVAVLAACGGTHSSAPDPKGTYGTRAHVIQEPDGFRNVTFSCYGPDGVYVTSAKADDTLPSGVAVVANDPNCR